MPTIFPHSTNPMTPSKTKTCLYCGAEYVPFPNHDGFCCREHLLMGFKIEFWKPNKEGERDLARMLHKPKLPY